MLKTLKEYKDTKEELHSFYNMNNNDEDFKKLIELDGLPAELKRILILMHSNYKAELKEQKSFNYRIILRILDANELTAIKLYNIVNEYVEKMNKEKKRILDLDKAHKYGKSLLLFITIIFIISFLFAHFNPHAFNQISVFTKDIVHMIIGGGKNTNIAPPTQTHIPNN